MHRLNEGHVPLLERGSNGLNIITHHRQIFQIWCHLYLRFNGMSNHGCCSPGACFDIIIIFPNIRISIIKIRRSWDRLIFIMGIPILLRQCLYICAKSVLRNVRKFKYIFIFPKINLAQKGQMFYWKHTPVYNITHWSLAAISSEAVTTRETVDAILTHITARLNVHLSWKLHNWQQVGCIPDSVISYVMVWTDFVPITKICTVF